MRRSATGASSRAQRKRSRYTSHLETLFGTKGDNQRRTELLVLITPRAIADRNTALQVTDEFRRKLNSLIPIQTEESAVEKASEKSNP